MSGSACCAISLKVVKWCWLGDMWPDAPELYTLAFYPISGLVCSTRVVPENVVMKANSSLSIAAFADPPPYLSSPPFWVWNDTQPFLCPLFPHFQHSMSVFVWPLTAARAFTLAFNWCSLISSHSNLSTNVPTTWSGVRALARLDRFPFSSPFSLYGLSYCMPELTSLTSYCAPS